jgi:AraC family transcriptional regulator, regulatory protein of adaptative response / methylated-DNA-[protein]-cysteine methyltransferase
MTTMAMDTRALSTRPSDAEAWRAVVARDSSYDGRFVYAVRSTRIYCRPSCPSRRPSRHNASFFDSPADAEQAGFRACLRCEPAGGGATAIARAVDETRRYLEQQTDRVVSLAELALRAGLSVSHLQRSFKRLVGVSPREYQDARRLDRFKTRLRSGDTVSRATYEAGFGSSSRVYERANAMLGMTPASYRRGGAGLVVRYTIADAPVGRVLVATTERGVCAVELGATNADVERALRADFPKATIERDDEGHATWVRAVLDRVRDPQRAPEHHVPLDVHGTAFQQQVWKALLEIPLGERRSYGEVAAAIGRPAATRAVAQACATNRVAVVIPCHRVVRADGALAGYKWGVDRKRRLLEDEAT